MDTSTAETDHLVGNWRLAEGRGATAHDWSRYEHHGVIRYLKWEGRLAPAELLAIGASEGAADRTFPIAVSKRRLAQTVAFTTSESFGLYHPQAHWVDTTQEVGPGGATELVKQEYGLFQAFSLQVSRVALQYTTCLPSNPTPTHSAGWHSGE